MKRLAPLLLLLAAILTGCHSRVSEKVAAGYRSTLHQWQAKLTTQMDGVNAKAAPYLDVEGSIQQGLGLSWYAAHREEPGVKAKVAAYARELEPVAREVRHLNSDTEMFIGGTDEWLRSLPASHMSRKLAGQQWAEREQEYNRLLARQRQVSQQLDTEVRMRQSSFLSQVAVAQPIAPPVAPVVAPVVAVPGQP